MAGKYAHTFAIKVFPATNNGTCGHLDLPLQIERESEQGRKRERVRERDRRKQYNFTLSYDQFR